VRCGLNKQKIQENNAKKNDAVPEQAKEDQTIPLHVTDEHSDAMPIANYLTSEQTELRDTPQREHPASSRMIGVAGLAVLVGQIAAYFNGRADGDDVDVVSFSLHHLFCRVDNLYRTALPDLLTTSMDVEDGQAMADTTHDNYQLWLKLRAIKGALSQVEPLCHLLNTVTEHMLDALDMTSIATSESQDTLPRISMHGEGSEWLQSLNQERCEHALSALTESLSLWQESYSQMMPFVEHFAQIETRIPTLERLDETFSIILDCAGAIFGDIVPGFQAISANDDEAVCTLLFDLMQQADQLQMQLDRLVEPLQSLIERFALGSVRS
jgi:hypothetical protein